MSHDLLAELQGYRNELAEAERRGRTEKAAAVRREIARVRESILDRVRELKDMADGHLDNGQDGLAAQCLVQARLLARAAEEIAAEAGGAPPASETAAEKAPRETATPRRKPSS